MLKSMTPYDAVLVEAELTHSEVCSVLMEWECRRRGAGILRGGPLFFLGTLDGRSVSFQRSVGPGVSVPAERTTRNKHLTKRILEERGISVPLGEYFNRSELTPALAYAESMNFEVVMKPVASAGGTGVVTEIQNASQFISAWKQLSRLKPARRGIVVEQRIAGGDYRLFVVAGRVVAALHRRPAEVTGDGRSTIAELILKKNELRGMNPDLKARPIRTDFIVRQNLAKAGFSPESVLPEGTKVQLRKAANLSKGGESVDVTDVVHEEFKEIAVRAVASIPGGLLHSSVDFIAEAIDSSPDKTEFAINELEGDPGMGIHHFPYEGEPRDVASAIVEEYFPGTSEGSFGTWSENRSDDAGIELLRLCVESIHQFRGSTRRRDKDADAVGGNARAAAAATRRRKRAFLSRAVRRLVGVGARRHIEQRRVLVSGRVQGVGFRDWISENARVRGLDGWVRNRRVESVEIVISGPKDLVEDFITVCRKGTEAAVVESVKSSAWKKAVQPGFRKRSTLRV